MKNSEGAETRAQKLARGQISKSRSAEPRLPNQKRSRERFERLLDVVDEILIDQDLRQVSIHDIARRAGVPAASVYHFFPTKEAASVALADRYLKQLTEHNHIDESELRRITRWQDLIRRNIEDSANFYNEHQVILKLFFGGTVLEEIRTRDVQHIKSISGSHYSVMNAIFEMPYLPDYEIKFSTLWSICDGITMTSYQRHGRVTPEFKQEMIEAALAYCRTFLPEVLPLRTPIMTKIA